MNMAVGSQRIYFSIILFYSTSICTVGLVVGGGGGGGETALQLVYIFDSGSLFSNLNSIRAAN